MTRGLIASQSCTALQLPLWEAAHFASGLATWSRHIEKHWMINCWGSLSLTQPETWMQVLGQQNGSPTCWQVMNHHVASQVFAGIQTP